MSTYTKELYGFSKPYRDELNQMDNTLTKNENFQANEINKRYNSEIAKLNKIKEEAINVGNNRIANAGNQMNQVKDNRSIQNNTIAKGTFKGLGGKLSETSNTSLLNSAQNVVTQAMGTTSTMLKEIDNDIARAKATRDVELANAAKVKFDLMYDNFYKVNEMYLTNRELLNDLEG